MNEIVYPVILTYEDNLIYVGVPDLKIDNYASYGETFEEAIQSAKEMITFNPQFLNPSSYSEFESKIIILGFTDTCSPYLSVNLVFNP